MLRKVLISIVCTIWLYYVIRWYTKTASCPQAWPDQVQVSPPYNAKSGTSGQRFEANVVRRLPPYYSRFSKLVYREVKELAGQHQSFIFNKTNSRICDRWVVVTTIFPPSESVQKTAQLDGWCVVVVADLKSPSVYEVDKVVYLSVEDQKVLAMQSSFVNEIPWNHFGRKNIGFFYAILHGAEYIFDLDDDNVLQKSHIIPPQKVMELNTTNCTTFNVYQLMGSSVKPSWPRGFPLENIKLHCNSATILRDVNKENIVIFQSLANHDPDVDAIYRMTLPIPFDFTADFALGIPKRVFTPYNAQASLHYKKSFWGLLLPITVHGRVSDIWRSYFTQRLLWDIDSRIAFLPAWVKQLRNPHNYIQDFQAETDLYLKSDALVRFLLEWRGKCTTLPGLLEELWIALYERDFIDKRDVDLLQAWIDALLNIGYRFPKLTLSINVSSTA